ncbi:hypothetical protein Pan216_13510 [Planctomycetes bacterium Pan216]|uniref:Alginate export domain-containing protein n=1 Tax=Kolteria novifilia TaxID=2527975 RepID=A0A518B0L5_9BACT|nr:hypothetical protein Pan216_13510 [Planctomycetes bacterium Pan216]
MLCSLTRHALGTAFLAATLSASPVFAQDADPTGPAITAPGDAGEVPPDPEAFVAPEGADDEFLFTPDVSDTGMGADPVLEEDVNTAPTPNPFQPLLFENNFLYLDNPGADRGKMFEWLKRRKLCGDCVVVSAGGQIRHQYKNLDNRSLFTGTPTTPRTNNESLVRLRTYLDAEIGGWFRAYVEYLDASYNNSSLPPLAIDENRSDLLNVFGEAHLWTWDDGAKTSARVGRQQLTAGAQRLLSPLFWANAPRTFSGGKLFTKGSKKFDTEIFWVRPTNAFYWTQFHPTSYDQPSQSTWLAGLVGYTRGNENIQAMPFLFILREEDALPGPQAGPGHRNYSGNPDNLVWTVGSRFDGKVSDWLYDIEGGMQLGTSGSKDIVAGMMTVGIGREMPDVFWTPTVWAWFDWASGDSDPFDGTIGTFNQLYPLAHKYFGFIDLVARQNVYDANFQVFVKPTKKLTLLAWSHFMWLAEKRDGLYNAAGIVSFQDPTGRSGQHIGNELDLVALYKVTNNVSLEVSYNHFWSGNFIRNQGGQQQAHLLYTQILVNF